MDLGSLSARQLLTMYGEIINELVRRSVIRTRNSPVGDYAETLLARALGGTLAPNSTKSWDLTTPDGERIQVKARVVGPETRPSAKFSAFRSFDFDWCVFVLLDQTTYEVVSAMSVPSEAIETAARFSKHIAGSSIRIGTNLRAMAGAKDLTTEVRSAADELDQAPSGGTTGAHEGREGKEEPASSDEDAG